jgi:hypothetical protein
MKSSVTTLLTRATTGALVVPFASTIDMEAMFSLNLTL